MLFRKRQPRERCAECSSFLLQQKQKEMGICVDCAKKSRDTIQKSFMIRNLIGLLLASIFSWAVAYFSVNDINNIITNLTTTVQIIIAFICFFLPFGEFMSLERVVNSSKRSIINQGGHGVGSSENGILAFLTELMIFIFSGAFFFIHRIFSIVKLSNYIKSQSNIDRL